MNDQTKTIEFLPEIFKTPTNKQFLDSTLDNLTSKNSFKRVEGYIGKKYGYSIESIDDNYVKENNKNRQDYQLQPSIVLLDKDTKKPKDFISYTGIIDSLNLENAKIKNHSSLFENEYYTWDPFVDYDKISNYSEYHWLKNGPAAIPITIPTVYDTDTFQLNLSDNINVDTYNYANPTIYLVRNGSYTFNLRDFENNNIWIQKKKGINVSDNDRSINGLSNNGTNNVLTFIVPEKSLDVDNGLLEDVLYYQLDTNENIYGEIYIFKDIESVKININNILGKTHYISPNGIKFTNGLKIRFGDNVEQEQYQNKEYYVYGVGESIELFDVKIYSSMIFDTTLPDYITIHPSSIDQNAWSRSNRWFHTDVLETTKKALGYVVSPDELNDIPKAYRPIIEYRKNLKLINYGNESYGFVDYFDESFTNIFNEIEGQPITNNLTVDGELLVEGTVLIFKNESNLAIKNNIYRVYYAETKVDTIVYKLKEIGTIKNNGIIHINKGLTKKGSTWVYKNNNYILTQQKTLINQYPLFDIFDRNGISLSDTDFYPNSTFTGTPLFSYTVGTGSIDTVLGFPISYSSFENIGDIKFDNNFNNDTFTYISDSGTITKNINTAGYVHKIIDLNNYEKLTGWVKSFSNSFQYQVFKFDPANANGINTYICDIPVKVSDNITEILVYKNDNILLNSDFSYEVDLSNFTTTVTLNVNKNDKITVLINSDRVSTKAYFDYPINLENNPFNAPVSSITLGDIRNQYRSIFVNNKLSEGNLFGVNNLHNLPDIHRYGTFIIQSSASLILPGIFLRSPYGNIFNSLNYNNEQYNIFKLLLVDTANKSEYLLTDSSYDILEDILLKILTSKENKSSFYLSDMLVNGNPYTSNSYFFSANNSNISLPLSDIWYEKIDSESNFYGISVYVKNSQNFEFQLIKGFDYEIDDKTPVVIIKNVEANSTITVREYNKTYGSYCPSTPTKLGLYPKFKPEIILYNEYTIPGYFIRGHDGSLTKLYGTYSSLPDETQLNDLRDKVLFEFEKRVFNNIKAEYDDNLLSIDDIKPGQFRTTDYSYQEFLKMYSVGFLNWVGYNKIDYRTQLYSSNNRFKFNYKQSTNTIDYTLLQQGYWKGIYRWLFDTEDPSKTPWEMLGLTIKPSWWDNRYGTAPYTNGNIYMWQDIANGYVWNNGDSYINKKKIRNKLLDIIPVDERGVLLSPLETIVANYNSLTFEKDWVIGDVGPAESAYLNSTSWPFDLMKLLVLTKPSKFFNLFVDIDRYKIDYSLQQILFDNISRLNPSNVEVPNSSKPKHSYLMWVIDYINNLGENGIEYVSNLLSNVDVRLTYNMSGFTSKNNIKFFIERATPYSRNTSFLIPDDNYHIVLYNNPATAIVNYSSISIQKVKDGWVVIGNSKIKNYFTISMPRQGLYETKTIGSLSVKIAKQYHDNVTTDIPYGHIFYSIQGVIEFLYGYGHYLSKQGLIFDYISDGDSIDWSYVANEFIVWVQQNWDIGSVITLNPNARNLKIKNDFLIVQPLSNNKQNYILNQHLLPIDNKDICIYRENNEFNIKVLSQGDTISNAYLTMDSIEHAIIFDNYTVFNDVIFNINTGLRHDRLIVKGYKTDNWQGYIETNGYILTIDNIEDWKPNKKYSKNYIVTYKNKYFTAKKLIDPSITFNENDWLETEYDQIKTTLLPNPSTIAYQSEQAYSGLNINFENDKDLLAYSLIGYRPRQYLIDPDLSDTSQLNIFKLMLNKGTTQSINIMNNIDLRRGYISYDIKENWMINIGDFGNIQNNNLIEFDINNTSASGNPMVIGFTDGTFTIDNIGQNININNLSNYLIKPKSFNFLPKFVNSANEKNIPTAGYVNIQDTKIQVFSFEDLVDNKDLVYDLYRNDHIWFANNNGDWGIFVVDSLNTQITQVDNNLNNTVKVTFKDYHYLNIDDMFAIVNFDSKIDGFYKVKEVLSLKSINIDLSLSSNITKIEKTGIALKLISRRFNQLSDIDAENLKHFEFLLKKYWIDNDKDYTWATYSSYPIYKESLAFTYEGQYGIDVIFNAKFGILSTDNNGKLYRHYLVNQEYQTQIILQSGKKNNSSNAQVICSDKFVYVSSPFDKKIFLYILNESTNRLNKHSEIDLSELTEHFTGTMAVSKDGQWLYAANSINQEILLFKYTLDPELTYINVNKLTDISVPAQSNWGHSIATSIDGIKLIVGAPNEGINDINNTGAVYVYNRIIERFVSSGDQSQFTTQHDLEVENIDVYVDNILISHDIDVIGKKVILPDIPIKGTIVKIDTNLIIKVQKLQSIRPYNGALFGNSVDTNRYGSDLIIGVPYEMTNIGDVPDIEGAVYKFTNSGQRYGVINLVNPKIYFDDKISIDGYVVNFAKQTVLSTLNITENDVNDNEPISNEYLVSMINLTTPTNIISESTVNGIIIRTMEKTVDVIYNILDIVVLSFSDNSDLGFDIYQRTQIITNLRKSNYSRFGFKVKMNERDGLLVSAITESRKNQTTFDLTQDCLDIKNTFFDNDTTIFIDEIVDQGTVYQYNYANATDESIDNPGKYVFGQYISSNIPKSVKSPKYGISLSYSEDNILVGSAKWDNNSGGIGLYNIDNNLNCVNHNNITLFVDKKPVEIVDTNVITNVQLYDKETYNILEHLDVYDPIRGKFLNAISQNIDFISDADPATYKNQYKLYWLDDYVGKTWLDTSTVRMIDYNQPDIKYNAKYFGKLFPGSIVNVYTWIESDELPVDYTGSGFPLTYNNYNSKIIVNDSSNSLITKYYYWVKNYDVVPTGKTVSPVNVSNYILNPAGSGISYLSPLSTNILALFNCANSLKNSNAVMHLGYGVSNSSDNKHKLWEFIKENDTIDFISGLPKTNSLNFEKPSGLYLKLINSFRGYDDLGNTVPDNTLPDLLKYGTKENPRQSLFKDRKKALSLYIEYVNDLLSTIPVIELRLLTLLKNLTGYWSYSNYWQPEYDDTVKPFTTVNRYIDLNIFLLTYTGLFDGLIVKVKINNYGNSEYYKLNLNTQDTSKSTWDRIGVENATIKFSDKLWTTSENNQQEIYWAIRWINEVLYKEDLTIHRNKSLMLMFNYIQIEQTDLHDSWLTKSSFVDIKHKLRSLKPFKRFKKDNFNFINGYINETKPYHVMVRDFVYSLDAIETFNGDISDFDLPPVFDIPSLSTKSYNIVYHINDIKKDTDRLYTDDIWKTTPFKNWYNNYGLSLKSINVLEQGRDYEFNPKISVLYDNINYPLPRHSVIVNPVLNDGKMIDISIDHEGKGYVKNFELSVEPSKKVEFSFSDINTETNTININEHIFVTGDHVIFTNNLESVIPTGLKHKQGYYVGVIDENNIALFLDKRNAMSINITDNVDDRRVKIFTQGDSTSLSLGITPRIIVDYSVNPIRSISVKIKFDRVTYTSKVTQWVTKKLYTEQESLVLYLGILYRCVTTNNDVDFDVSKWEKVDIYDPSLSMADKITAFYKPSSNMPGNNLAMLMSGVEYPNNIFKGEVFTKGWDAMPWDDITGWDARLDNPEVDTILRSPSFALENEYVSDGSTGKFVISEEKSYRFEQNSYVEAVIDDPSPLIVPAYSTQLNDTSDFTIEFWVKRTQENEIETYVSGSPSQIAFKNSIEFGWHMVVDGNPITFTTKKNVVELNKWVHVAFVRANAYITMYVNGESVGKKIVPNEIDYTAGLKVGDASESFVGYISNLRFIVGRAQYITKFKAPNWPRLIITNETQLLLFQEGNEGVTIDKSINQATITVNGVVEESLDNPFVLNAIKPGYYIKGKGLVNYKKIETLTETSAGTYIVTVDDQDGSSFISTKNYNVISMNIVDDIVTIELDDNHQINVNELIDLSYNDDLLNRMSIPVIEGTVDNIIKVNVNDGNFTQTPLTVTVKTKYEITEQPSYYDVYGGEFMFGYGPEELVPGIILDKLKITVTTESDGTVDEWKHYIYIDRDGKQTIVSNTGVKLEDSAANQWWYGQVNERNSTLSEHPSTIANLLRS